MKKIVSLFLIALAVAATSPGISNAQDRTFNTQKVAIDDGSGHNVTLQAPVGLLASQVFTFPTTGGTLLTSAILSGLVTGVTGGNGITVSNLIPGIPNIAISAGYTGGTSISTLGTITSGAWNGTAVGVLYGGTGATTANGGLNNLLPSQTTHASHVLTTDGTNTSWTAIPSAPVSSVFGRTGAVVGAAGDYTTSIVAEGTNLYYTDTRARAALSGTAPITYSTATGAISISNATTTSDGSMTAADKLKLNAITGTNTGDQTITLTGPVTGTGTGSFATTITNGAVTYGKIQNVAANSLLGNNTGVAATALELTPAAVKSMLSLNNVENTALSTWTGSTNIATVGTITSGTWNGTPVGVLYGGTGSNTANGGLNNLLPSQATHATHVLTTNGTNTSWTAIPSAPVSSVFGRTGAVVGAAGDYTTSIVAEGTNLYYTDTRARAAISASAPLSYNNLTGALSIANATTTTDGTMTAADKVKLNGITGTASGTNTGDQTITLTGPVTGTGTGTFATTITNGAVTYGKIQNVAANSILGNNTGAAATAVELAPAAVKSMLSLNNVENTALSTWTGSTNVATLGTIASGTWNGTAIGVLYGGTGATTANAGLNNLLPSQTTHATHVLTTDGTNTSWAAIPSAPVTSVFGRTGAVVGAAGDYTTSIVAEGTNLYYTDTRARAALSGTAPITYSSATGAISLANAGVTYAKIQNVAANSILGNNTGVAASAVELSAASVKTMLALNNVENTALSTWAGSTNLTTLGTIASGTWNGTMIAPTKGGTGLTAYTTGDLLYASAANTLAALPGGVANNGKVLTISAGLPSWQSPAAGISSVTGTAGQVSASTVAGAVTLGLPNVGPGVTSVTNASLTLDAQGRVTAASSGTAPVTSITGGTGITVTGTTTPTIALTTPVGVANGGSGSTSAPTPGGIIYGASATAYGSTGAGTAGQLLLSGGAAIPTWSTNITATNGSLSLGATGQTGSIALKGTTAGNALTIQPAASTASYTVTMPAAAPVSAGDVLTFSGAGVYSWAAPGASTSIQNQTTQQASSNFNISGAGVVGTSLTAPTIYGGSAAGSLLTLDATSNGSPSGDSISLQTGSSGGVGMNNSRVTVAGRHLKSTQTGTVTASTVGAMTSASVSNATDVAGTLTLVTNGSSGTGDGGAVTFATAYSRAPIVMIAPASGGTYLWNVTSVTTTGFRVVSSGFTPQNSTMVFNYFVIETQ